jgi:tetratricopeptide (TPR) repeat protein
MHADNYNQRGLARRDHGDYDGAYADFTECIRIAGDNPAPYFNRGLLQMERGQLHEALADFDSALHLDPREPDAITHRASTRSLLGDFAGALADCDKLLALYPDQPLAHLNRATIRFNHSELAPALDDVSRALELDPNDASAWKLRGLIHRGMGNVRQALDDMTQGISLDPAAVDTYRQRAATQRGIGNVTAALKDFREAIRLEQVSQGRQINFSRSTLEAGQCWEYDAPAGQSASRLHIVAVEEVGKITVVHVAVSRLRSTNPKAVSQGLVNIEHLPIEISSVRESIRRLDMDCPIPTGLDLSGYLMWHKAVAEEQAGAWGNPVKDVVSLILAVQEPCESFQPAV